MNFSNEEIIIFAFVFATLAMIVIKLIGNVVQGKVYLKNLKRTNYLQELVKKEEIPFTLINISEEPTRIAPVNNNNGLMVDGEIYDNRNSLFLEEDGRVYILGKKEDFVIALVGGAIGRR